MSYILCLLSGISLLLGWSGSAGLEQLSAVGDHWLAGDCHAPLWCDGADLNRSGHVDSLDMALLGRDWLGPEAGPGNWMSRIDDSAYLCQLSLPGTHNSGALYEPVSGTARCQNLTIAEQLAAGVRFLDIRCRHIENAFTIHHGMVYQNINFDDVLSAVFSFLDANPSETVIMSVMETHDPQGNTRSFEATFDAYVAQAPQWWHLGQSIPQLGQVRGKVVLLRRFGAGQPKGINATNWPDNTDFWIENESARLRVQDYYRNSSGSDKWNAILPILQEAPAGHGQALYLNFTSGYRPGLFGIPSITTISNSVNPQLQTYFEDNPAGRFGAIVMDFATAELCQAIIETNFDDYAPFANGTYRLVSEYNGQVVSVGPRVDRVEVVLRAWADRAEQRWLLTSQGGGYYQLISGHSGHALSTSQEDVVQHNWQGDDEQLWQIAPNADGTYRLINKDSSHVMTMKPQDSNVANVGQLPWAGDDSQRWRIEPLDS